MTEEQRLFQEKKRDVVLKDFKELEDRIIGEPGTFREYMVAMRDGCRMRTVVCLPPGRERVPVILQRTPYPNSEMVFQTVAQEMTKRGFGYVYSFCRGTGGSEGEWYPNTMNERTDGKDTVDWLAEQPFTESLGVWGNSYAALTGWIMADLVEDKAQTMYLTHYGLNRFSSMYSRGMFRQDVLTSWAMDNAGQPVTADFLESAAYRPQIHVDEDKWGIRLDWYREWITHTDKTDPYWQQGFWHELQENGKKIRMPLFVGTSWFDHHFGSTVETWKTLSPECRAKSTLRIGAWSHFMLPCMEHIETEHLGLNDNKNAFLWFESILVKGEKPEGRILSYQVGGDNWETSASYPFPKREEKSFYLSSEAANWPGATRLTEKADSGEKSLRYTYDPENPVETWGAEACLKSREAIGSLRQPSCGYREDVLSFVTEPLAEDLEILGVPEVELWVSSDAEDTAFTAKLMEIYPDGEAYNIRSGIATMAYPESDEEPRQTYTPQTKRRLRLHLWDTSWKLKAGSRLRVDISSSDFPQYSIHTNFAGNWAEQQACKTAEQTVFCGGDTPSRLVLPLKQGE
ncbi:MAG: CocE/NonD family hydrolase [Lachnospiraceae bacterium]|nr:CocE/NonD family hydrolase [Lachnospiraceae bacterium]